MWAAQALGENAIIVMALDIPQLYAGDLALTDIPLTPSTGCREIPEAGPTEPAATDTQAGHPTEAGSLAKASPTEASAPAEAPPKTLATEAKEDDLTMEEEVQPI